MTAAARQTPSWWWPGQISALDVATIRDDGPDESNEDHVSNAWATICNRYFYDVFVPPNYRYIVRSGSCHGQGRPSEVRPDILVIRITMAMAPPGPYPHGIYRDCVWIECKAPNLDLPRGWRLVMKQAITRLEVAHPNRRLYLLLAIGLRWMMFVWDPTVQRDQNTPLLEIVMADAQETWSVDSRVYHIHGERYMTQAVDGRMIVDTDRAHTLNYWDLDAHGNPIHLASLQRIEWYFDDIKRNPGQFPGANSDRDR
ncbi:hypothetical protein F5X98DRAFT_351839 [Xylaria grammica]|nr:hypothetical protein F5X98DRAFT_351839 [Xylaria grammica]